MWLFKQFFQKLSNKCCQTYSLSQPSVLATTFTTIVVGSLSLQSTSAQADITLGIEMSPAVCSLYPSYVKLRQCVAGNPMSVNFLKITNKKCTNARYSMTPLQESLASKLIPDVSMRQQVWQNYGRCSGMNTSNYFRKISQLSSQLKLPKELSNGKNYQVHQKSLIKQIVQLNAGLQPKSISLFCQVNDKRQSVLTYINICYNDDETFGQCTYVLPSCPSKFMIDGSYQ